MWNLLTSVALCLLAASSSGAQTPTVNDAWSGTVGTANGQALAEATVELRGPGGVETAKTQVDGKFFFAHVAPGPYSVVVRPQGRPATQALTVVLPGPSVALIVTYDGAATIGALSAVAGGGQSGFPGSGAATVGMEGASAAPSANGTASGAAAGSAAATGGEKLSSESVSSLPLNGRDFSTLLLLAAGTMTDVNGATNFTQQFAIDGQRGVEAVFAMDGADVSDPEMGGSTFTNFNVDAIQEIQSSSGWMPAEIGRGAAGFTDIVTRSGKAGFHGSVFEFLRNSALDARNYFDYPSIVEPGRIPPFKRNEFGFK